MTHLGRSSAFRLALFLVPLFSQLSGPLLAGVDPQQPAAAMGLAVGWVPEKGAPPAVSVDSEEAGIAQPDGIGSCSWSAATAFPVTILDQAMTSVGGAVYAFGGVSTSILASSYKFDGSTWTPIAPLPLPLEFPSAVTDGTNIYIVGGAEPSAGTPQTSLFRYNVASNSYTPLASFTTGTWNQATVYLGGKIYKFAGTGPATASTDLLEIYDVAGNTWSAGAPYPLAISFVSAWTDGTYVYGAGGIQSVGSAASMKTYRYDPVGNAWSDVAIADLPATRWGAATTSSTLGAFGDAVLAGGYVDGTATANISPTAIHYDLASDMWLTLPNMVAGERARMSGAELNSRFYVVGGRSVASPGFVGTSNNQQLLCTDGPVIDGAGASLVGESCGPDNGAIDPGEAVVASFCIVNSGLTDTVNLVATLQPTGGVTLPDGPQVYGAVIAGDPAVCHDHGFTADPAVTCGATITASIQFQDGAADLGTVAYSFVTGVLDTSFSEDFDGVAAPALPVDWTTTLPNPPSPNAEALWTTTASTPDTAPNAAFVPDPAGIGLSELETPAFVVASASDVLSFRNKYVTENTYDGGVLEISIAGGAYQDIVTAGGSFVSGGYTGVLSSSFSNPLAGRNAWSGTSAGGYLTTVVTLPPGAAGQSVKLKWRMGSDSSVAATGWWIDGVSLAHPVCNASCSAIFADGFESGTTAAWSAVVP